VSKTTILILLLTLSISCKVSTSFTGEYRKTHTGKIVVEVPEVFELVNIGYALTENGQNHPWMVKKNPYFDKVVTYFKDFSDHELIQKLNDQVSDSYYYYFQERDNAYDFRFSGDKIVRTNYGNLHGSRTIKKDLRLWEDFAKKSKFREFYHSNRTYYEELKKDIDQYAPVRQMWQWLENKFPGIKYDSYKIVTSPLIRGSHSTARVADGDFSECIMFVSDATPKPEKYTESIWQGKYSRIIFTEIDHNYVNPTTSKFRDQISKAMADWENWNEQKQGYTSAQTTFNEYMTWAVYTLYLYDNYSDTDFARLKGDMEDFMVSYRGFNRFREFNQLLLELYQEQPYSPIESFYNPVIEWINNH
jgi:Domain of unknown function (DUF4932)